MTVAFKVLCNLASACLSTFISHVGTTSAPPNKPGCVASVLWLMLSHEQRPPVHLIYLSSCYFPFKTYTNPSSFVSSSGASCASCTYCGGHTPHSQLLPLFTVQSMVPPHDRQEGVDPGVTAISEHLGQHQTYNHRSVSIHRVKL